MVSYELTYIVAIVGVTLFTTLLLISPNYKWNIVLGVVGLVVFTFVLVSHIDRLKAKQWTLWDVIIVTAILFVVIWIIPDIMKLFREWRRREQK